MLQIALAYLADDHLIVSEGVASLLKATGMVGEVRTFRDGKSLLNACKAVKPGVIFLDYEMPGWSGLDTLQALRREFPDTPVYMLSMNNEKSIIGKCIEQGASGYLSKDSSPGELQEALAAIESREIYYSREVLKSLAGIKQAPVKVYNIEVVISAREREILKLICDGMSPKEIADKLYLSKRTVDTHKNNIMQKLEVNSVGKLISLTLQNNLLK